MSSPNAGSPALKDILLRYSALFAEQGLDSPRLSAELIVADALGLERNDLIKMIILEPNRPLTSLELERAQALAQRRAAGEPCAYLTGNKEFYGRSFLVSPATLIPRPESELLIDLALAYARTHVSEAGRFADLGSGTGCLAITFILELPAWQGLGLELNPEAVALARQNAVQLGVGEGLEIKAADFLHYPFAPESLDMIISNPPYISEAEYTLLGREVRSFEPKSALVPGPSGLEHLEAIVALAEKALKPGGLLLLELGCTQGAAVLRRLRQNPCWKSAEIVKDLAGLDRAAQACKTCSAV